MDNTEIQVIENYDNTFEEVDDSGPDPTLPEGNIEEPKGSVEVQSMPSPQKNSKDQDDDTELPFTLQMKLNLLFCLLAWACTACNQTLVVGTGSLAVLSVGGGSETTSLPLGAFFVGASLVSLLVTPWVFSLGRKLGFLAGIGVSMVAACLGCVSVITESVAVLLVSNLLFGASTGIGFYLRYAAVEVVPSRFAKKAVALVIGGGCLAAFIGPESARGTVDMFGEENLYLGVFLMTAVFSTLNLIFTVLVEFPEKINVSGDKDEKRLWEDYRSLVWARGFVLPTLVSGISWAAMAMPMSIVRVTMGQLGYTDRQSLTTLELHFLGMFMPGLFNGGIVSKGYLPILVAIVLYCTSALFLLISNDVDEGSVYTWIIGLFIVGVAWNFGFNGATVRLTNVYKDRPIYRSWIQASHDALMFAFAGAWTFSSSYISDAGGGERRGWQTVILTSVVLIWVMAGSAWWIRRQDQLEASS